MIPFIFIKKDNQDFPVPIRPPLYVECENGLFRSTWHDMDISYVFSILYLMHGRIVSSSVIPLLLLTEQNNFTGIYEVTVHLLHSPVSR